MYALNVRPPLAADSDFAVASATVHRPTTSWFEGYFGVLAALGALHREHLPLGRLAVTAGPAALCFPGLATSGAALGLISVALGLEKLLVFSAEGKGSRTIGTLE